MSDANPKGESPQTTDPQPHSDDDYEIKETADTTTGTEPERGGEPKRVALQFPEGRELGVYKHLRHRGDDETIVLLSAFGSGYQAIAYDINAEGDILDIEIIGHASDEGRAAGMCEYWLKQNPKGILGQADGDAPAVGGAGGGGGIKETITGLFGGD